MKSKRILLTGASGLIGSALLSLQKNEWELLSPGLDEFDLLNPESVTRYIHTQKPDWIIHAAAFTDAAAAEKERGKKDGLCYLSNCTGTQLVVNAGREINASTIYISTGSVFNGTDKNPGPYKVDDPQESDSEKNNWYGYTKYLGEMTHPFAVIRISHPIIPDSLRIKDDYVHKMYNLYKSNSLYPLFPDQFFPLTFMPDIAASIDVIMREQISGNFHIASSDLVSPYELMKYILNTKGEIENGSIKKLSIKEFYELGNSPLRFSQYSAISSLETQRKLKLSFQSWKKTIDIVFGKH